MKGVFMRGFYALFMRLASTIHVRRVNWSEWRDLNPRPLAPQAEGHKNLSPATTRRIRLLYRLLLTAIALWSLLTVAGWAKAESVEFGWYLLEPLNGQNFVDVTAVEFVPGKEHLTLSGMMGSTADLTAMPINGGCMTSYVGRDRVYRCTMETASAKYDLRIIASGTEAGDGVITLLDASGAPVKDSTRVIKLAHSKVVE